MPINEPELRLFTPQDGNRINALFAAVFHGHRSLEEWRWKFLENPHGDPVVVVAEKNEEIIGHYGLIPRRMRIDGQTILAYQDVDLMVHPDHTRGGVFKKMGEMAYETAHSRGGQFTFGFPNQTSFPIGSRLLKWRGIGHIPLFTWVLSASGAEPAGPRTPFRQMGEYLVAWYQRRYRRPPDSDVTVVRDELPPEDVNPYPSPPIHHGGFRFIRDPQYLRWRYRDKPGSSYTFYTAVRHDRPVGSMTVALCGGGEAYIAEMDLPGDDLSIVRSLLAAALTGCSRSGCRILRSWAIHGTDAAELFTAMGAVRRDSGLFYNIRSFLTPEMNRYLWDPEKWYISAGDSDCI